MIKQHAIADEMIAKPSAVYQSKATTILFATDLSPECGFALNWTASLAPTLDARLLIVHVEQPGVPYGGGEIYTDHIFDCHSKILLTMLDRIRPSDPRVPYSHRLACGDPTSEILRIAGEEKVHMIVMSTHGRRGLPRMLLGSVAESIIRRAECPVLIIKRPKQDLPGE
jgi:universal stress protein A